jgi:2-polyprenyl-6-methoxyphenol hydroxylase-like FAD-dependent oxidoreductase
VTGIRGHGKGGAAVSERARVVVGADGRHSLMAKTVQPAQYEERRSQLAMYYAYWSNLPAEGFETTIRAE